MSAETALVLGLRHVLEKEQEQHAAELKKRDAALALVTSKYRSLIDNLNEREDTPMACSVCDHWFAPDDLLYDTPLFGGNLICKACYKKLPVTCARCKQTKPLYRMGRSVDISYYAMEAPYLCDPYFSKTCK